MKIVFGIFSLIVVIFTIDFVMTNNQPVTFGSWLLPWRAALPVGLAVLGAFALGLVIGGLLAWSTGGRARRRARLAERRVESLERELSGLVRRAESAEREAITTALPPPGNGVGRPTAAGGSAAPGAPR